MDKLKLGNSEMVITRVGLGAWAIGGGGWEFGWGPQNDNDSIAAIHKALELGINWIDTAAVYGLGHSEEIVARALALWKGPRPYVFTKCGLRWNDKGKVNEVIAPESVRQECEDSLRRLKVETIDLYQIHWPTDNIEAIAPAWEELTKLKEAGKLRWIGVSNFNVEQLKRCLAISPVTSLQPNYSLVNRKVEPEILPFCKQQGIGVIAYSPMGAGLLTGSMTRERLASLPEDDWRHRYSQSKEPNLTRNLALAERLRKIGARHDRIAGEVAVAWVLKNPAVTGAIVGVRNAAQVEQVMKAASLKLSDAEIAEIESD